MALQSNSLTDQWHSSSSPTPNSWILLAFTSNTMHQAPFLWFSMGWIKAEPTLPHQFLFITVPALSVCLLALWSLKNSVKGFLDTFIVWSQIFTSVWFSSLWIIPNSSYHFIVFPVDSSFIPLSVVLFSLNLHWKSYFVIFIMQWFLQNKRSGPMHAT